MSSAAGAFVSPSGPSSPGTGPRAALLPLLSEPPAPRAPRPAGGSRGGRAGCSEAGPGEGGLPLPRRRLIRAMPAPRGRGPKGAGRDPQCDPPARGPGLGERPAPAGRTGRGSAGRERRGRGRGCGAPALAAAGLLCTALAAYSCWGQLPPPPWAPPAPPRPVGVLLWWEPFAGRAGGARRPPDCWLRFRIRGCRLLADRAAYGEAQAVLFHHRDLVRGAPDWPPPWGGHPRPPGQRWVWMNFESPSHSPGLRHLAGDLFNWTLSYRADSDVFVPYGRLYPRAHPGDPPPGPAPPLARKRGLVAWVVSNWDERQARVRYYRQLSRHVPVDVFGRAGPGRPVPDSGLLHTVARYKFYLAFENSQHPDYITEKLWRNALLAGAVPVVLGPDRANYERFLPRGAFIHVDDFPSASSLAAHLLFLDRNPAVYRRYFHWRRSYAVHITSFWDEPWCRACQAVQAAGDRPQSVRNLARWFER
ncbi:alpha-(1,3)-fucosyltransferase 4 [Canis lupus dingo]|uniref:alpha-(1,3)-fucosyltransferase 4 n=1 Tax=Canis lupus dingo TaxID=286419 RepID=UPI000DC67A15|nr:alpha-(1,3)-fucosyltransferase 4 [Canis lupus dingo]